jgi:hypothetical protein
MAVAAKASGVASVIARDSGPSAVRPPIAVQHIQPVTPSVVAEPAAAPRSVPVTAASPPPVAPVIAPRIVPAVVPSAVPAITAPVIVSAPVAVPSLATPAVTAAPIIAPSTVTVNGLAVPAAAAAAHPAAVAHATALVAQARAIADPLSPVLSVRGGKTIGPTASRETDTVVAGHIGNDGVQVTYGQPISQVTLHPVTAAPVTQASTNNLAPLAAPVASAAAPVTTTAAATAAAPKLSPLNLILIFRVLGALIYHVWK